MSRKAIGILLAAAVILAVFIFGYWYLGKDRGTPPEDQNGTELVESLPSESEPSQTASGQGAQEEAADGGEEPLTEDYRFLLVNNNNYVAVYQLPENEIYEYTDVILDVLPAELQEEIREGKYLRDEEELYNFLENYTS